MEYQEFMKKKTSFEEGIKRVQFKFLIIPVIFAVAVANLFIASTTEQMVTVAIVVVFMVGLPLQWLISRRIKDAAKDRGFVCQHCDHTFPVRTLEQIATTGRCPKCDKQVLNT